MGAYPDQAVLGLELLGGIKIVIDQAKAGGLAATELHTYTEHKINHQEYVIGVLVSLRSFRSVQYCIS